MVLALLSDLKVHLNIPASDTSQDLELQDTLNAATDVVGNLVGNVTADTVTEQLQVHNGVVFLDRYPTGPVLVTGSGGGAVVGFSTRSAARLLTGVVSTGYVSVTYTTGTGFVPAAVRLATLIVTAHLWETQRGVSPSALALQGVDPDIPFGNGAGYAIPNRAKELLAPYLSSSGQIA